MNRAAIAALDKWHAGQLSLRDWREKREALREAAIEVTGVSNPVLENFVSRSEKYFEERKQRDEMIYQ